MVKDGIVHGLVRYEYKGNLIEETRKDGMEHGLRVVCTQMGDIWLRLHSNGKRLAQIVLSADYRESANPRPIDDGGLKELRGHMHLVTPVFRSQELELASETLRLLCAPRQHGASREGVSNLF